MNGRNICDKCGRDNPPTRYFCEQCGRFLKSGDYSDPSLYALPEMKVMRIVDNLQHVPHTRVIWDDMTDLYVSRIEKLKALFGLPEMGSNKNSDIIKKMDDFFNLCHKPDFQIAFVGTIKTGKSTLINALLGKNYASMAVTPETAALTKFRASAKDYVDVTFYTPDEWRQLWNSRSQGADKFMEEYNRLNGEMHRRKWIGHPPIHKEMSNDDIEKELEIWSSSQHAEHYFVKEIEVGISTLASNFPQQVVFVDTPGLSDPVVYRSELSRNYIRRANAVFVCIEAKKTYEEEIKTIASVFSFSSEDKSKVHIIATHWDTLNYPVEDWKRQKEYLVEQFTGKAFFDTPEQARENIMHSAAFIYNLCRDFGKLDSKQYKALKKFALTFDYEDDIKGNLYKMAEMTNIDNIMDVIRSKLVNNYKRILMSDIKTKYNDIVYDLKRAAEEKRGSSAELLQTTSLRLDESRQKIEEHREKREVVQSASNQLQEIIKKVKLETRNRTDEICGSLRRNLVKK